jgi:hypothetical protein
MKKYIVFWEWDEEDTEKGILKSKEIDKLREEEQARARFPKSLGSSYVEQSPPRGFTLFEATEEQLENWKAFYGSVLKITKIQPIIHASEFIKEYESTQKQI